MLDNALLMAKIAEVLAALRDPIGEYVAKGISGNIELNFNDGHFVGYNLHIYRKRVNNGHR